MASIKSLKPQKNVSLIYKWTRISFLKYVNDSNIDDISMPSEESMVAAATLLPRIEKSKAPVLPEIGIPEMGINDVAKVPLERSVERSAEKIKIRPEDFPQAKFTSIGYNINGIYNLPVVQLNVDLNLPESPEVSEKMKSEFKRVEAELKRADTDSKIPVLPTVMEAFNQLKANGYDLKILDIPFSDVLNALIKREPIGAVNVTEMVQNNPRLRFACVDDPIISLMVSNAISAQVHHGKLSVRQDISKKGVQKIAENADEFASRMFNVINNLKREEKVSTYRETVKTLNDKKIPTYRGGEWHVKTLQNLQDRWKQLGLIENPKPK